jgi:hypothetical protein
VGLTKLVLLSLVVAALMPRGKLESCDGLVGVEMFGKKQLHV